MNLNELLKTMVDENASDLHITAGSPPRIRKGGKLIPISNDKLSLEDTKKIIESEISETNKDKLLNYLMGLKLIILYQSQVLVDLELMFLIKEETLQQHIEDFLMKFHRLILLVCRNQ